MEIYTHILNHILNLFIKMGYYLSEKNSSFQGKLISNTTVPVYFSASLQLFSVKFSHLDIFYRRKRLCYLCPNLHNSRHWADRTNQKSGSLRQSETVMERVKPILKL